MNWRVWLSAVAVLALAQPALANHSALERISVYPPPGTFSPTASFAAATSDGSRVIFAAADNRNALNGSGVLFERAAGTTTLISADAEGQPILVQFLAMSADGSHVFF